MSACHRHANQADRGRASQGARLPKNRRRLLTNLPLSTSPLSSFSVLPRSFYPVWATSAFDWYLDTYGDPLVRALDAGDRAVLSLSLPPCLLRPTHIIFLSPLYLVTQMTTLPAWFKALVWSELTLQLPFFLVAVPAFVKGDARIVKPAAAYGVAVATTLVPILADLAASEAIADEGTRRTLLAFYFPYFAVPLTIGVWALRAAGTDPFAGKARSGRAKRA